MKIDSAKTPLLPLFAAALLLVGGCGKLRHQNAQASPLPPLEACSLLTPAEIEAIQGSPIKDTKSSGTANGGLRVSQCFFSAAEFSKSVSLSITQTDTSTPSPRSAKSFWNETFGKFEGEAKEGKGDEEKRESLREQKREGEEEEGARPKKITGVGDAAYWTASRVGGALYVLHKDAFLRISIGGPDPEDKRIEKCKALAEKALARM